MLRRLLAAAVRWALHGELETVKTEIGKVAHSVMEIEHQLAFSEPDENLVWVLYWVTYTWTYVLPGQPANSRRFEGCGSLPLNVNKGGIKTANGMFEVQDAVRKLLKDYSFPIVQITNLIELSRSLRPEESQTNG